MRLSYQISRCVGFCIVALTFTCSLFVCLYVLTVTGVGRNCETDGNCSTGLTCSEDSGGGNKDCRQYRCYTSGSRLIVIIIIIIISQDRGGGNKDCCQYRYFTSGSRLIVIIITIIIISHGAVSIIVLPVAVS